MAVLRIVIFCMYIFLTFAGESATGSGEKKAQRSVADPGNEELMTVDVELSHQNSGDQSGGNHGHQTPGCSHGDHKNYYDYYGGHGPRNQYGKKGLCGHAHDKKGFHNVYHKEEYGHSKKYNDNANYIKYINHHADKDGYHNDHHVNSYDKYGDNSHYAPHHGQGGDGYPYQLEAYGYDSGHGKYPGFGGNSQWLQPSNYG